MKTKVWTCLTILFLLIGAAAAGYGIYQLQGSGLIPAQYLNLGIIALVLLWVIFAVFLLLGIRKRIVLRILGCIFGGILVAAAVMLHIYVGRFNQTINTILNTDSEQTATLGIYVPIDSDIQSLEDLEGETLGVLTEMDGANTSKALEQVEADLNTELATQSEASILENVDALSEGSVQAILMNEAYLSILPDFEGYEDFEQKYRLLTEVTVTVDPEEILEEESEAVLTVQNAAAEQQTGQAQNVDSKTSAENVTQNTNLEEEHETFVLYISGSDTRSKILDVSRSDVNILMLVDVDEHEVLLLNTPRDYFVENPAGKNALDKLTHCGIYGVNNSMKALEQLYDISIDYYGQINFTGFETVIDAIGGVTVDSPEAFTSGSYSFEEGENELDGAAALAFARERYAFESGDNMRGQNQMRVIQAVINKLSTEGTSLLQNYTQLLESLENTFVTDFPAELLANLIQEQLSENPKWTVETYAVTGEGGYNYTYSAPRVLAYVMYPDEELVEEAKEKIADILD